MNRKQRRSHSRRHRHGGPPHIHSAFCSHAPSSPVTLSPTWGPAGPDDEVAFMVGWCDNEPAHLEQAKKGLHDRVIESLAGMRDGPIEWHIMSGDVALDALRDRIRQNDDAPELAASYDEVERRLREFGGFMVVASAKAKRP